jgi:general secretion pathway protein B
MSLILDALKKSEQERQRDRTPGLQSIHQPPVRRETQAPRYGVWLVAIAAINAAALGYWLWSRPATTAPIAATVTAPAPTPAAPPSPAPVEPAAQPPAASADAEFTQISPSSAARPQQSAAGAATPIQEVGDLPDDVRNNLPAMTFSFHVYSANPEQRTIIINNRRMRAGDEVAQGLQLQEITEDGVILGFRGHRIHIGVLTGW